MPDLEHWKTLRGGGLDVYAVLGFPVGHSLSPPMHNAAFKDLGLSAVYVPYEVEPGMLKKELEVMAAAGVRGANVTVPLKEEAFAAMDFLDESAELYRAVNTVSFGEEGLAGASTDGVGFLRGFEEAFGRGLRGLKVLVLGAGGAGRSVALACAQAGAASIRIYNRTEARADTLCEELNSQWPDLSVETVAGGDSLRDASLASDAVLQCTSLGLHEGDADILGAEGFRGGHVVYDLIYSRKTPILQAARSAGAEAASGLGMLVHQGVKSFEIWTGKTPSAEVMRAAVEKAMGEC
jgi:shikimate dehydrogenase